MKTVSFIGSDKNAGKTTAFNFIYRRLMERSIPSNEVCITSIGINGEDVDFFDGRIKPKVKILEGSYFITASEHLEDHKEDYEALHCFSLTSFTKEYMLARCRSDFETIMEGPNCRGEIMQIKETIQRLFPLCTLLLDGSADRQFLAHPEVSDAFYFSLLITPHRDQLEKAMDLLLPLSFPLCKKKESAWIKKNKKEDSKSLLFDNKGKPVYEGREIPFLDENLKDACRERRKKKSVLYLNGALSNSLFSFLAPMETFDVILDNLFLYRNMSSDSAAGNIFLPGLFLLHTVNVLTFFIHIDKSLGEDALRLVNLLPFPEGVPLCNLFKDKDITVRLP